jgi:hypothetical protein
MRQSFPMTWILLVLGIACSSSDAGKAPTKPDSPSNLPDPMNGQTGSVGQCECTKTEQCSAPLNEVVSSLKEPGHHNWHFVGSECVARDTKEEHRCCFAHPTVCLCHRAFGDGDDYVPENDLILGNKPLCDMEGRSNDCLYGCKDFPGCDPAVATSCDATCADLAHRIEQDEAKTFDAQVRSSTCTTDTCRCESVLRVDNRCYASFAPSAKVYDCSLTDAAILADAYPSTYVGGPSSEARQLDPNAPNWCE